MFFNMEEKGFILRAVEEVIVKHFWLEKGSLLERRSQEGF